VAIQHLFISYFPSTDKLGTLGPQSHTQTCYNTHKAKHALG